jgi:hypothetical protein
LFAVSLNFGLLRVKTGLVQLRLDLGYNLLRVLLGSCKIGGKSGSFTLRIVKASVECLLKLDSQLLGSKARFFLLSHKPVCVAQLLLESVNLGLLLIPLPIDVLLRLLACGL